MLMTKKLMKVSIKQACLALFFLLGFPIVLKYAPPKPTSTAPAKELWELHFTEAKPQSERIACDRSHRDYDICSVSGPVLLNPATSTLYALNDATDATPATMKVIKTSPYPRKKDRAAMENVKELTLSSSPPAAAACEVAHGSPALVFSAGGYTGNFFHEFNDGFVPLFVTINSLFPGRDDVVLVITDCRRYWLDKYASLFRQFSRLPVIDLDRETASHCFPSVSVGLITHGYMAVDPTKLLHRQTLTDFIHLLKKAYGADDGAVRPSLSGRSGVKPRLVLVGRKGNVGRVILNQDNVIRAAEEVGFDVVLFEPSGKTSLAEAFDVIHGSHAMLGVHGAALTHLLFLRRGAVLVQVVPIETSWLSETCFGMPARNLGLEYIEYVIRASESSLVEKYGAESLVVRDPRAFHKGNWTNIMRVFLKEQNVKVDVVRFRKFLETAYQKAKQFMERES